MCYIMQDICTISSLSRFTCVFLFLDAESVFHTVPLYCVPFLFLSTYNALNEECVLVLELICIMNGARCFDLLLGGTKQAGACDMNSGGTERKRRRRRGGRDGDGESVRRRRENEVGLGHGVKCLAATIKKSSKH